MLPHHNKSNQHKNSLAPPWMSKPFIFTAIGLELFGKSRGFQPNPKKLKHSVQGGRYSNQVIVRQPTGRFQVPVPASEEDFLSERRTAIIFRRVRGADQAKARQAEGRRGQSKCVCVCGVCVCSSICLRICLFLFPLFVLKGIYHYWDVFFPGGLKQMEDEGTHFGVGFSRAGHLTEAGSCTSTLLTASPHVLLVWIPGCC